MNRFACNGIELSAHCADAPRGQWVQLLPLGEFDGRDGRGPFRVDDAAAIIRNSLDYSNNHGIPVDYDHQIDNAKANGKPAIAAGWIKQLEARDTGIWGLVGWTDKAAAHVAAKEYRFLSPVIGVSKSEGGAVNVILRAALTNNPNLTQLEAIAAMEAEPMNPLLQKLKDLMGLPPEATEEDVLAKITPAFNASTKQAKPTTGNAPDPTKWVPIADFEKVVSELNRINQGVEKQSAETHVEEHIRGGRLPPYLRNWGVELCMANKPQFDQFVDRTKRLYEPLFKVALSGQPSSGNSESLTEQEQEAARRMGLTDKQFLNGKR